MMAYSVYNLLGGVFSMKDLVSNALCKMQENVETLTSPQHETKTLPIAKNFPTNGR